MQGSIVHTGCVVSVAAAFFLVAAPACEVKGGRAVYTAKSTSAEPSQPQPPDTATTAQFAPPATPAASASASAQDAPAPVPSASTAPPVAACPQVCTVANPQRGRMAAADEGRFATGLAEPMRVLHGCARGPVPPTTLRFDSVGVLTYFGVEESESVDEGCAALVRHQLPAIVYAGPATVRCTERCGRAAR